jgi:hypothetical protein
MREAGVRPEAIVGVLGHSLGLTETPEPLPLQALVERFAWERVVREPWRVTPETMARLAP